jgi:hypothetical protein
VVPLFNTIDQFFVCLRSRLPRGGSWLSAFRLTGGLNLCDLTLHVPLPAVRCLQGGWRNFFGDRSEIHGRAQQGPFMPLLSSRPNWRIQ